MIISSNRGRPVTGNPPSASPTRCATRIAVVGLALATAACGSSDAETGTDTGTEAGIELPTVVVTTSILGDMVTAALGDLVGSELVVEVIVPAGADGHDFAPSARQAESMENADLLVVNGLGYEEGMVDVIDNAIDGGATVFAVADSIEAVAGADPHAWLDPVRMAAAFDALPEAVAETTGVAIDDIRINVDRYIGQLGDLDATIRSAFATIPPEGRQLVTNHDALSQFAGRYDFTVIDTIIPSVSTSAEASAADLDEVLDAMRTADVRAIFSESTESDALAQALADELGGDVAVVELFTESLGEPGSGAETYVGMMTVNAERIAAALS